MRKTTLKTHHWKKQQSLQLLPLFITLHMEGRVKVLVLYPCQVRDQYTLTPLLLYTCAVYKERLASYSICISFICNVWTFSYCNILGFNIALPSYHVN